MNIIAGFFLFAFFFFVGWLAGRGLGIMFSGNDDDNS